ncbi:capsid portal protein, partial [Escherichia coli]|nr:capsid portal protein [Escherichia coli]
MDNQDKISDREVTATAEPLSSAECFTFGDPIPVLDRRELLDYVECVQMDRWYEPPVSFAGLARTYRAAVHHSSPIAVKRDILRSTYIPHRLLSQQSFTRFVQDYLVFGNAYLEKRTNRLGGVLS